jgi:hypothetical protein
MKMTRGVFVHELGLQNHKEWLKYCRRELHGLQNQKEWLKYCRRELHGHETKPANIPSIPSRTYKTKGWINWGNWLGTGTVAASLRQFRTFSEARDYVRNLGLHNVSEWRKYCKGELLGLDPKPSDIPAHAYEIYINQGWISWSDWLGTLAVERSH